jgi:hypothetical protein
MKVVIPDGLPRKPIRNLKHNDTRLEEIPGSLAKTRTPSDAQLRIGE